MAVLKLRIAAAAVLAAGALCGAADPEPPVLERRVKAAFLSKFAGYVEWPMATFAASDSPIVIGVAGEEALASELEQAIAGRRVAERPMLVRRLGRSEAAATCCQILFVGRGVERGRIAELLMLVQGKPVLTVTESESGQLPGSVIHFLTAEDRVRFDISRDAAERNGLRLGSQLLSVARQVKARTP